MNIKNKIDNQAKDVINRVSKTNNVNLLYWVHFCTFSHPVGTFSPHGDLFLHLEVFFWFLWRSFIILLPHTKIYEVAHASDVFVNDLFTANDLWIISACPNGRGRM